MKQLILLLSEAVILTVLNSFTIPVKVSVDPCFTYPKNIYMLQDTAIPVKVQLEKTSFNDMQVLYINDTAATTESIKDILGKGYGELMQFIQGNQLQPQKFMSWYYSMQPPWTMDIAVETNKLPVQLSGRIQSRTQRGGAVVIAHMWGPYDQVGQAYTKIYSWLRDNNLKAKGSPFEVYINDPNSVSPSEIQTDIYQPIE